MNEARPIVAGARIVENTASVENVNPATGEVVGRVFDASPETIEQAMATARRTAGEWHRDPSERRCAIERLADLIERDEEAIGRVDCEDMGKPIGAARSEALEAAQMLRQSAQLAEHLHGEVFASNTAVHAYARPEPVGIVAAITPWNYPMPNIAHKVGPALAAGNAVLLKPSEIASRSAVHVARLAAEAGLPDGALSVLTGRGQTVGRALAAHPEIDMVSFTGSTASGRAIMAAAAASNAKRLQLECGGKSPQIVFADSDVERIVPSLAADAFANSGQLCVAKTRLLVERSIGRELVERLVAEAPRHRPGDPTDPGTRYGPIASALQFSRITEAIAAARAEGLKMAAGAMQAPETRGYFVEPTVFADVPINSALAQQEIFGPVLAVTMFDSEEEAVELANSTMYGLSASVWTRDLARAHRLIVQLRAGSVHVFSRPPGPERGPPMFSSEPIKQSGFGIEGGLPGLLAYTYRKGVEIWSGPAEA